MSDHYDEQIDTLLVTSIDAVSRRIHEIAEAKGFWNCQTCKGRKYLVADGQLLVPLGPEGKNSGQAFECPVCDGTGINRNDGEAISLMHSELSELLEGLRDGNPASEKLGDGFTQADEEGADLVIRLLDLAHKRGWKIAEAMVAKIAVNADRPYLHGREF